MIFAAKIGSNLNDMKCTAEYVPPEYAKHCLNYGENLNSEGSTVSVSEKYDSWNLLIMALQMLDVMSVMVCPSRIPLQRAIYILFLIVNLNPFRIRF